MISKNAVTRHATILITIISAIICDRKGDTIRLPVLTKSALDGASLSFDLHGGVACLD
ncbi:hypothetical protein [Asaia bogorensis]|uniref:hypothetical protein n=1 Tax=Asaia bogorensis TaxID=91915 RepID=UPI00285475CF|nr:hypothetical protein [Asaia bogorensis]MDR6183198.1 hypothetical protein [Asaia bogorensis NBRC 16594]